MIQTRQDHIGAPKAALVGHVMNSHDRGASAIPRVLVGLCAMVGGDKPGLPVVAMDDIDR